MCEHIYFTEHWNYPMFKKNKYLIFHIGWRWGFKGKGMGGFLGCNINSK